MNTPFGIVNASIGDREPVTVPRTGRVPRRVATLDGPVGHPPRRRGEDGDRATFHAQDP